MMKDKEGWTENTAPNSIQLIYWEEFTGKIEQIENQKARIFLTLSNQKTYRLVTPKNRFQSFRKPN